MNRIQFERQLTAKDRLRQNVRICSKNENVSVLHRNSGGIGKSIPDSQEIS